MRLSSLRARNVAIRRLMLLTMREWEILRRMVCVHFMVLARIGSVMVKGMGLAVSGSGWR